MPDNRNCFSRDTVCIDCNRVLDSCRDKDCFENVRVYLTDYGQDLIERSNNIRVKSARVIWCQIALDSVPYHCGFYQVTLRFYTKLCLENCVCLGNPQEFEGIAVAEKKVILYGSEGNVSVFKSDPDASGFCARPTCETKPSSNLPIAVCEVAEPVVLDLKVVEPQTPCCCCCCASEVQNNIGNACGGNLNGDDNRPLLLATLGFFTVVRIERPGQFLISATENSVPEKECVIANDDDPCAIFRKMDFPVSEFAPPPYPQNRSSCGCQPQNPDRNCGCK
jgi:hypothetical protein